jgi:nucleotide-binding universal stress UspA family protein
MHPQLSLKNMSVDQTIARKLPRGLARYYVALPIAQDEDGITLIMAHPDDQKARGVLARVLGAPLMPIQGAAAEIRAAIDDLWSTPDPATASRLLFWSTRTDLPPKLNSLAETFAAGITILDAATTSLDTALDVAQAGGYNLLVVDHPEGEPLPQLARKASIPLLILRGDKLQMHRILLVLRGHSPDESALDWIIPLAQATGASVTLLAVAPPMLPFYTREIRRFQGVAMLLSPDSSMGEHVMACSQRLVAAGVAGNLKLRQGSPRDQIASEAADGDYDMIAIAAEAHGDFVQEVLTQLETTCFCPDASIMVLKPAL